MRLVEFTQTLAESDNPVASAITRRILLQRSDLLSKYGPVAVTQAIDDVADFVGDVEEIGSSDVSGWIKQVEQSLASMGRQGVEEGGGLDRYRQRVNSQGFTDSPEERNADRLERKRRHQDALNRISDIGGGSSDEERAHQAQQRMARDEYKLDRLKRNDDDWENTFDMMRDRMNRYQWSSQRDVDPEQLAAISNIKYEPRKKNESSPAGIQQSWTNRSDASYTPGKPMPQSLSKKMSPGKPSGVQAKTDDELLAYYAQRKAEKEKEKQSQQGVAEAGRYGSNNPDTMSASNYDRYQQDQMDQGKRDFKRREHEHEWEQEKAYTKQLQAQDRGPWYIRIDGKIYRQGGQPKSFDWKKGANNYALAMVKNNPSLQGKVMLSKNSEDK